VESANRQKKEDLSLIGERGKIEVNSVYYTTVTFSEKFNDLQLLPSQLGKRIWTTPSGALHGRSIAPLTSSP